MDYKKMINNIGYSQINRSVEIPDFHLMIGESESHESIPVLIFTDIYSKQNQNPKIEPTQNLSYEKVASNFTNDTLSQSDFGVNEFYLGDSTE